MKYSYMLLVTLVISSIWGLLLFILGCFIRFNQTMFLNNYLDDLESNVNLKTCIMASDPSYNICPAKTKFDDVSLGSWVNNLAAWTICCGFLVILMSAFGLIGVLKKSQALLLLMLVMIIGAIAMEYYLLDIALGNENGFNDDAKDELREKLNTDYELEFKNDVNDFTLMLNAIMLQGECCGIVGPEDFVFNSSVPVGGTSLNMKTPPSCCNREAFQGEPSQGNFDDLLQCSTRGWSVKAVSHGCYSALQKHFYEHYGVYIVGFLMFLIIWEGIQGILLFMIILRPSPKSTKKSTGSSQASQRSGQRASVEDTAIKPKKFVPYSNVSDYVHEDVNRIKSTEIW